MHHPVIGQAAEGLRSECELMNLIYTVVDVAKMQDESDLFHYLNHIEAIDSFSGYVIQYTCCMTRV